MTNKRFFLSCSQSAMHFKIDCHTRIASIVCLDRYIIQYITKIEDENPIQKR